MNENSPELLLLRTVRKVLQAAKDAGISLAETQLKEKGLELLSTALSNKVTVAIGSRPYGVRNPMTNSGYRNQVNQILAEVFRKQDHGEVVDTQKHREIELWSRYARSRPDMSSKQILFDQAVNELNNKYPHLLQEARNFMREKGTNRDIAISSLIVYEFLEGKIHADHSKKSDSKESDLQVSETLQALEYRSISLREISVILEIARKMIQMLNLL